MGTPKEFAISKWMLKRHPELAPEGATVENGTKEEDERHIADCWFVHAGGRISVGVRSCHPLAKHRDFRIRAHREGRPVEAAALRAGESTYALYVYVWEPRDGEPVEYVVLDVNAMRGAGLLEFKIPPWRETPAWESDGTMSRTESFYSIHAGYLFKHGFAVKADFYDRVKESGFLEELLEKDYPRERYQK